MQFPLIRSSTHSFINTLTIFFSFFQSPFRPSLHPSLIPQFLPPLRCSLRLPLTYAGNYAGTPASASADNLPLFAFCAPPPRGRATQITLSLKPHYHDRGRGTSGPTTPARPPRSRGPCQLPLPSPASPPAPAPPAGYPPSHHQNPSTSPNSAPSPPAQKSPARIKGQRALPRAPPPALDGALVIRPRRNGKGPARPPLSQYPREMYTARGTHQLGPFSLALNGRRSS